MDEDQGRMGQPAGPALVRLQVTDFCWEAIEGFLSSSTTESNSSFKTVIPAAVWQMNWKSLRESMDKVRHTLSEIWKKLLWNVCIAVGLAESQNSLIILWLFSFWTCQLSQFRGCMNKVVITSRQICWITRIFSRWWNGNIVYESRKTHRFLAWEITLGRTLRNLKVNAWCDCLCYSLFLFESRLSHEKGPFRSGFVFNQSNF